MSAFHATLPMRLGQVPADGVGATAALERPLTLFVCGFNKIERQLLEGVVRLSQRRKPRLELVAEADAMRADVVMVDSLDSAAMQWAQSQPWLKSRTAIWVDQSECQAGHIVAKRPVQWPILPMLIARAMETTEVVRGSGSASRATPGPSAPERDAVAQGQAARQLLVVDDSLAVRNHLRSLLEARGFAVSEASSVREALAAVAQQRFDCALMDVLMPDLDGYEGCKRLKSMKSTIGQLPVVMLTSKSSPFDRIRGKMAGCDAYLTKPVEPMQLYDVLAQQLAGARQGEAAPVPATATPRSPTWPRAS